MAWFHVVSQLPAALEPLGGQILQPRLTERNLSSLDRILHLSFSSPSHTRIENHAGTLTFLASRTYILVNWARWALRDCGRRCGAAGHSRPAHASAVPLVVGEIVRASWGCTARTCRDAVPMLLCAQVRCRGCSWSSSPWQRDMFAFVQCH